MSHTPGPWVAFHKPKYGEWHVGVPMSSGSMKLALFPDGCPTDNPEADAHLIAAAPLMLSALRRAALALAFAAESSPAMQDDYAAVSAAISKATGAKEPT